MDLAFCHLPPIRRLPYFLMSVRRTHDADILRKGRVPFYSTRQFFPYWLRDGFHMTPVTLLYHYTLEMLLFEVCSFRVKRAAFQVVCVALLVKCVVRFISLVTLSLVFFEEITFGASRWLLSHIPLLGTLKPICFALVNYLHSPVTLGICSGFKSIRLYEQNSALKYIWRSISNMFVWQDIWHLFF